MNIKDAEAQGKAAIDRMRAEGGTAAASAQAAGDAGPGRYIPEYIPEYVPPESPTPGPTPLWLRREQYVMYLIHAQLTSFTMMQLPPAANVASLATRVVDAALTQLSALYTGEETAVAQLEKLAAFLLEEISSEPSQSEGVVDTIIRITRERRDEIHELKNKLFVARLKLGTQPHAAGD